MSSYINCTSAHLKGVAGGRGRGMRTRKSSAAQRRRVKGVSGRVPWRTQNCVMLFAGKRTMGEGSGTTMVMSGELCAASKARLRKEPSSEEMARVRRPGWSRP